MRMILELWTDQEVLGTPTSAVRLKHKAHVVGGHHTFPSPKIGRHQQIKNCLRLIKYYVRFQCGQLV